MQMRVGLKLGDFIERQPQKAVGKWKPGRSGKAGTEEEEPLREIVVRRRRWV
jgi:hypothetical protein